MHPLISNQEELYQKISIYIIKNYIQSNLFLSYYCNLILIMLMNLDLLSTDELPHTKSERVEQRKNEAKKQGKCSSLATGAFKFKSTVRRSNSYENKTF